MAENTPKKKNKIRKSLPPQFTVTLLQIRFKAVTI